jgi:hypothetical protein
MTTPTVTELPSHREPVTVDTVVGDLAIAERRRYGDVRIALTALGLQPLPPGNHVEPCEAAAEALQEASD